MQIQVFKNKSFGKIRVIGDSENPLFCLSDVCKVLDLSTPAKIKKAILKEFELYELNSYSFDNGFGKKNFTMITEPQLYFILMRSDKPKAKPFRQWVVNDVLPSIRKQGYYIAIEIHPHAQLNSQKKAQAPKELELFNRWFKPKLTIYQMVKNILAQKGRKNASKSL